MKVFLYDPETKEIDQIHVSELSPGCLRFFSDETGEVFARGESPAHPFLFGDDRVKPMFRHAPFTGELAALMRFLSVVFKEVFPHPPDWWENSFRREEDMEDEIHRWRCHAQLFTQLSSRYSMTKAERIDIFRVVASCGYNGLEAGPYCVGLAVFDCEDALHTAAQIKSMLGHPAAPGIGCPDGS